MGKSLTEVPGRIPLRGLDLSASQSGQAVRLVFRRHHRESQFQRQGFLGRAHTAAEVGDRHAGLLGHAFGQGEAEGQIRDNVRASKQQDPASAHFTDAYRASLFGNGEAGIRTRDTGMTPYNGLANRRFQPLSHLSGASAKLPIYGEAHASQGQRRTGGNSTLFSSGRPECSGCGIQQRARDRA